MHLISSFSREGSWSFARAWSTKWKFRAGKSRQSKRLRTANGQSLPDLILIGPCSILSVSTGIRSTWDG